MKKFAIAAAAAALIAAMPASAATTIPGSAISVDLGEFGPGVYRITGSGLIDLIGAPGSGFDILPNGTPSTPVTDPNYLYFNPTGSFTADGSLGPAGNNAKIGALIGTLSASPSSPSDYFLIGFGRNITLTTTSHIYAGVNDTYLPNNGGSFTADVSAVPEPATWAMMMLGFGMVGFGLRRRQAGKVTTRIAYA